MSNKNKYGNFWAVNPNPSASNTQAPKNGGGSSQNARKHGCCSEAVLIIEGESMADYQQLEATWFKAFYPTDEAEKKLIHELVRAEWFLERSTRVLAEVEAEIFKAEPNPLKWTEDHHRTFARFQRYFTARSNDARKTRKAVMDYRRNRAAEQMKEDKHEVFKEKAKRAKKKADDASATIDELIEQMGTDPGKRDELETELDKEALAVDELIKQMMRNK